MLNVEKIVTISLNKNQARREQTQKELAALSLETEFHLVDRDIESAVRGCFNSHVEVAKQALAENRQNVLVFEDDVKTLPFTQQQIEDINQFLADKSIDFDLLYLGLIIDKMWYCGKRSIVRAKGSGAHAYILSRKGIEKLAGYTFQKKPIDKVLKHDFKCYSVYPMIAEQYPETVVASDISPFRYNICTKDEKYWRRNYAKQKWLLWKNLHKTLLDFICR